MDDQYPVSSPDQDLQPSPSLHIRTQTDAVSVGTFITSSDSHFAEKDSRAPDFVVSHEEKLNEKI